MVRGIMVSQCVDKHLQSIYKRYGTWYYGESMFRHTFTVYLQALTYMVLWLVNV